MGKVYLMKDKELEFYAQVEIDNNIWKFFDRLAYLLYDDNSMVSNHYHKELKNNDYFSFEKEGTHLIIIIAEKRAHVIVLGLPNNKEVRSLVEEFSGK